MILKSDECEVRVRFKITSNISDQNCTTRSYTCQLSRLRVENFDLTPAHACGPISLAWLKNVSCCRLAWHNFQKYFNSDPCKERKPRVKWINDNIFLAISDFVDKRFLVNFAFGRLRTSSEDFGHRQKTSDFFGRLLTSSEIFRNDRVVFKNPSTPRIKISRLYLRKSWQVYYHYNWHRKRRSLPWILSQNILHESVQYRHFYYIHLITYLQIFSWAKQNYLLVHCGLS